MEPTLTRGQYFNLYTVKILAALAENFPVQRRYEEIELGLNRRRAVELEGTGEIAIGTFYGTYDFLLREGYVYSPIIESRSSSDRLTMVLTAKGLQHLSFRFTKKGLMGRETLAEALIAASKKPENWLKFADLISKFVSK